MGRRAAMFLPKLLQGRHLSRLRLHCSPPPLPSRSPVSPLGSLRTWCVARSLSYGSVNLVLSEDRSPVVTLGPFHARWVARSLSHGSVNLVLDDGKPRFETHEIEQPKKGKYLTKKRLKLQRKRERQKRREANKTDPRRIRPKGKKNKARFPTAEDRIKHKIEKAKIKETLLVEKLKKYEISKVEGPEIKPEVLTGEERFYLKKMAHKKSNYVPVGRRGIYGGVILNMHLHWKKHETVKVICRPCRPGQVHEYAKEIARLSGGIPIQIIGSDTIIFYRGKNYVQPEVMSPIDTLSKKKALEKSKYEQSLDTVRRFIAISEKELEIYYRHVALYGDPNSRNADLVYGDGKQGPHVRISEMPRSTENIKVNSTSHDASARLFDEENFSSTGDDDTSDDNSDDEICSSTSDDMSEDICDEESVCLSHDTSSTSLSEAESDSEVNSEDEVNSSVSLSEAESDSDDAQLMAVEIDSEGEPVLDYEVNSEDEVNSSVSLSDAESDSDDGQFMAVEIDSEGEPVLDSEVNSEDEVNSSASLSEAESDSDDGQLMTVEIDSELDSEDEVSSSVSLSEAESDSDDGQLMAVEIDSEREQVLDSEVHSKDEENTAC
ncbi:hypothetical protein OPV22_015673 [Ensete ventricosum]|uniref:CRM domain-containing protein n=1 Tax=Ensete ventricosum TaxID=4639 RepID=A0AAV8RAY3_ENSVE|nr:hypothetical protein OPV22_015673 [Ensete ventricosum]